MRHMPNFLRLSVLLCGCFSSVGALAKDLPTVSEVLSGYRQNLQSFDGLYVRWRVQERQTKLYRQFLLESAQAVEREASSKPLGDEQKAAQEKYAQSLRESAKTFDPARLVTATLGVFSVDGHVQLRIGRRPEPVVDGPELDQTSLTGFYSKTIIWSRPSTSSRWLCWAGSASRSLGSFEPKLADNLIRFLPPGLPTEVVPPTHLHLIDRFFASPPESLVVVGFDELFNTPLLIVERIEKQPPEFCIPPERMEELRSRLRQEVVMRAWIDPSAGYWPRRIESYARWFLDDREVPHPTPPKGGFPPDVDDVVIEKTPNGGYFPTHGVIRQWYAVTPVPRIAVVEIVDGRTPVEIEMAPLTECEWFAEAVTAQARTEFQLDKLWPSDVQVYDIPSGQILVQDAGGDLVRAKAEQLVIKPSSSGFRLIWVVTSGVVLALGIGVWLWRRSLR